MMVAALSGATSAVESPNPKANHEISQRPPLLPSEKDNGYGVSNTQRKPKSRVVSSRYMPPSFSSTSTSNSSSSRRFPSPLITRNSTPLPNSAPRSISVDRRRSLSGRLLIPYLELKTSVPPEVSSATKLLVTSTRSLSVSFQGEAFSLPISKTKVAPPASPNLSSARKRSTTPSRGDQVDNLKLADQHRWPGTNPLSKCLNYSGTDDERRPSFDTASDSDSVSSGSTNGVHESAGGMAVSVRFWQETSSRSRRLQDSVSSSGSKMIIPPKVKRLSIDGSVSSPRAMLSPGRGIHRAASPSKLSAAVVGLSPSRGYSPARIRNGVSSTICNKFMETPSVLSFAVDVRRGKVGENRISDAHLLRLLYNRHLQWGFVNAATETVLLIQKHNTEKDLCDAWITISYLRDTVMKKRYRLQMVKQKLKLASILKQQMRLLEHWACLEKDHVVSLIGAVEALRASTLRLPVTGGASADVQSLKDAITSAVDVMKALASSIYSLLQMVEETNSLVTELAKLMNKERASLEQCTDLLSFLADMKVRDCSLRTHIIQCNNRVVEHATSRH